jgi:hypothetical protein
MPNDTWYRAIDRLIKMRSGIRSGPCFYCDGTGVDPETTYMDVKIKEKITEELTALVKSYVGAHSSKSMLRQLEYQGTKILIDAGYPHLQLYVAEDSIYGENTNNLRCGVGRRRCPMCHNGAVSEEAVIRYLENNKPPKDANDEATKHDWRARATEANSDT